MSNCDIEYIRGILSHVDSRRIDLTKHMMDGELEVYLNDEGHVCRYWSCCAWEDVDLEDPGNYGDFYDDIEVIMCAIQDEIADMFNKRNRKGK